MSNEQGAVTRRHRPVYRDTNDMKVAGVASGLGHYFDIDTTLVRVAFLVFTLVGGAGPLAYVVLWLALSPAPSGYYEGDQDQPADDGPQPPRIEVLPGAQPPTEQPPDDVQLVDGLVDEPPAVGSPGAEPSQPTTETTPEP